MQSPEIIMATLRPARCYRAIKRPFTRQSRRKPRKGYAKGVPGRKITKFEVGDPNKEFSLNARLLVENAIQIRHNALEAARVATNKYLTKALGDEYFLKILIFPHHVMRDNPTATGAGADRFQTGMRKAYGRPIGTAAQVKANQPIILIRVDKAKRPFAKEALKRAATKIPGTTRITYN